MSMTEAALRQLLERESNQVDWKAKGDPLKITKTLAAFANDYQQTGGGCVLCGVSEETETGTPRVVGLSNGQIRQLRDQVLEGCRGRVSPPLSVQTEQVPLPEPGLAVLIFSCASSPEVHRLEQKVPIRVDDRVVDARDPEIATLYRRKGSVRFLEQPCAGATKADINPLALDAFLGRLRPPRQVSDYLLPGVRFKEGTLPLMHAEPRPLGEPALVPYRFALLLFGNEPTHFFPGAYVTLARFPSAGRDDPSLSVAQLHGPIPKLIEDLLGHLRAELGLVVDKTQDFLGGGQNRPRYAEQAVREALVNALVHRDYEDGNPTKVSIFPDRLEISNPGGLPSGVDPAHLTTGRPHWRNPSLANYLIALGLAQAEGSGIPLIIRETQTAAGRPPLIESDPQRFTITIPAYTGRAPSGPSPSPGERPGRPSIVLISIGGGSIRDKVASSLSMLRLPVFEEMDVVEYTFPGFVDGPEWAQRAREIRRELKERVENSHISSLHLFYRGPVVLAPLIGALVRGVKPLHVYYYDDTGQYQHAYTIDRRFLTEEG
jgi:ATP-dependent DNA helicase RecG